MFDGYWEDIGTIRSFYEANLQLAAADRPFDLASAVAPIYTRARFLAPSRLDGVTVRNSLIADGCEIEDGTVIENSVIGVRCRIGKNVTIRDSVLMGNDEYETAAEAAEADAAGTPRQGIGAGTTIRGAIIDKNCRIGAGRKHRQPTQTRDHRGHVRRNRAGGDPRRHRMRATRRDCAGRLGNLIRWSSSQSSEREYSVVSEAEACSALETSCQGRALVVSRTAVN